MWSFMIALHSEKRRNEKRGVQLFQQSLLCNALPDTSTLLILMSSCRDKEALASGKRLHVIAKSMGCDADLAVGTALLSMYSRCGDFQEAKISFDKILKKSVVSWNAMIAACVQHGYWKDAIQLFICMQQEGFLPNIITFLSAASACTRGLDVLIGQSLHVQASNRGLESEVSLAAAFVNMYGKFGFIESACSVFHRVHVPCVVLCTGMLTVYCQHGYRKEAFYMFQQMQEVGILPNDVTFLCILSACSSDEFVLLGKRIHAQVAVCGLECSTAISTALAVMYGKFGRMEESYRVFSSLAEKSTLTWNARILVCVDRGQINEGIQLFVDMLQQGMSPDKFTFVNVLQACACLRSTFKGKVIHQQILQTEFRLDGVVCNALIDMYGNCMLLSLAQSVFDGMHQRNTISWNTLVTAYTQSGDHTNALILFDQMQGEGVCPDAVTFATILNPLAQRGGLRDCWRVHNEIIYKGFDLDLVVATNLIATYGTHGCLKSAQLVFGRVNKRDDNLWSAFITMLSQNNSLKAFQVLDEMRNQGFIPSRTTLASCLSGCSSSSSLTRIRQLHVCIVHSTMEVNETEVWVLVSKYAECGDLCKAWCLFDVATWNLMSWNSMIGALAGHGEGMGAHQLFSEMKFLGISPNGVTYLHLLSAYNHSGLVEDAFRLIISMKSFENASIAAFHYDCIIDLLGRAGQLHKALLLINAMPFKPTVVTWTSLLGACTNMSDMRGGENAANYLFEISVDNFVPYILLSKMYFEVDNSVGKLQGQL